MLEGVEWAAKTSEAKVSQQIAKILWAGAVAIAMTACSGNISKNSFSTLDVENLDSVNLKKLTYKLRGETCETPLLKFESKEKLCNALLDDDVNEGCARKERLNHFEDLCVVMTSVKADTVSLLAKGDHSAVCVTSSKKSLADTKDIEKSFSLDWLESKNQKFDINPGIEKADMSLQLLKNDSVKTNELKIITLTEDKSEFSLRARAGSKVSLTMLNSESRQDTQVTCQTHIKLATKFENPSKVRCGILVDFENDVQEKKIVDVDLKETVVQQALYDGKSGEKVVVRVKNAGSESASKIEVLMARFDTHYSAKAESTVTEGLELGFKNPKTGKNILIICAPASK